MTHVSIGNWSKPNERGGVVVDDLVWVERLVRCEERLAYAIADIKELKSRPIDNPEILECLAEIGQLLEESLNAGDAGALAVPAGQSAAVSWISPELARDIARRSVYGAFALVLFVISELLKPDTPAAKLLKSFISGGDTL